MTMKLFIKYALRAHSIAFARTALSRSPTGNLCSIDYRGKPVFYRQGTSDGGVIYEILFKGCKSEYWHSRLPQSEEVETVLDIGANIGAATVFFSELYPNAKVHSFEPIPNNFRLLQKNAQSRNVGPRISCHSVALSDKDGELEMIHSPNESNDGGWSFYQRGATGSETKISVPVRKSGNFLRELGVNTVDVIKIDTEGAEKEILYGLDDEQLVSVKYIVGELHGERDFELLDWLERKNFDIECKKSFGKPCFIFKAIKRIPP